MGTPWRLVRQTGGNKYKMSALRVLRQSVVGAGRRNYGISAVLYNKAPSDPIQKLFLDKVREYGKKSKAAGGKLVDASPEVEKQLAQELAKTASAYGGAAGGDMTKFPSITFQEPTIDKQISSN